MTMTTVGYGDVVILSTAERLYACFAMLLGAITFAYMLGNVQVSFPWPSMAFHDLP